MVYEQAIKKLEDVAVRLNAVSVYDINAYTVHELLYEVIKRFNELAEETNRFEKDTIILLKQMADELDELLRGDKVEKEINKTLTTWKDDGIFDQLIQGSVFTDFENRLSGLQDAFPELKQEVEEKVEEAIETFENFNNPQFENYPMFFKSFAGVRTSVIQDFRKVDDNRWLVSQVGGKTSIDNGESFTLTMVNTNGEILSSMEVIHGGHGSMFNCQLLEDGSIDIYFTSDSETGYKIIKTKYIENGSFNANQVGLTTIPKTSTECQLAYFNFYENLLLLATTAGAGRWYKAEVFKLNEYINGSEMTPLFVTDQTKIGNITSQGFAVSNGKVFVYAGTLGENNTTLRIIDMNTRYQEDHQLNNLGKIGKETITEAEGIYVDENKNVFIGIATGAGGTIRNHNVYVFAHKDSQQQLLGKAMESSQTFKLTDGNGYAMGLSPLPSKIADIVRPGWYYFTTNEMGQFSDVPAEYAVAGYWLHVFPRTKDGGVYQELIRHTSGKNRWRLGRSINTTTGEAYEFRCLSREYKTLYANTDRSSNTFKLSDSISNYDLIQFRVWGAGGKFDIKTVKASTLESEKAIVFHTLNIGDGDSSTGLYVQEARLTISSDLMTFTYDAKVQLGWNGSTFVRSTDATVGVIEVIGIRG